MSLTCAGFYLRLLLHALIAGFIIIPGFTAMVADLSERMSPGYTDIPGWGMPAGLDSLVGIWMPLGLAGTLASAVTALWYSRRTRPWY